MERICEMEKSLWIIMSILLLTAAIEDIREKRIRRWLLMLLVVVGSVGGGYACMQDNSNIWQMLGGMAIGLCMIGFSLISQGQIGIADGVIIGALGILCGARSCLIIVSVASMGMALLSIVLLASRRGNRHTCLPFVPALLVGFLVTGWIG